MFRLLILLPLLALTTSLRAQGPSSIYQDAYHLHSFLQNVYSTEISLTSTSAAELVFFNVRDNFTQPVQWRRIIPPTNAYQQYLSLKIGDHFFVHSLNAAAGDSVIIRGPYGTRVLPTPLYVEKTAYGNFVLSYTVEERTLSSTLFPLDPEGTLLKMAWRSTDGIPAKAREFAGKTTLNAYPESVRFDTSDTYELGEDFLSLELRQIQPALVRNADSLVINIEGVKTTLDWAPPRVDTTDDRSLSEPFLRITRDGSFGRLTHGIKTYLPGDWEQAIYYNPFTGDPEGTMMSGTAKLTYHTDLQQDRDADSRFSVEKLFQQYANNPFIAPILSGEEGKLLRSGASSLEAYGEYFFEQYPAYYPWHAILYGDSTLQLEEQLSLEVLNTDYRQPITARKALDAASTSINENRNKGGLLDARTVAVGLSDFIAERAQEELNLTFFERFKENLNQPSELTVLFPNTRDLLQKFQISNYKTLLSFAKTSFQTDLDNLGLNFPRILDLPKYQALKNDPNVFNLSLIYTIADLAYREYPIETIVLAANQQLRDRKRELGLAIDEDIARGLMSDPQPEDGLINLSLPNVKRWLQLQDDFNVYLAKLDEVGQRFGAVRAQAPLFEVVSTHNERMGGNQDVQKSLENAAKVSREDGDVTGLFTAKDHTYLGRTITEAGELDFARSVIKANLKGQEFLGYLLENPRLDDYATFFSGRRPDGEATLTRGLTRLRKFLTLDAEGKMRGRLERAREGLRTARDIETHLLLQEAQRRQAGESLRTANTCADLLQASLELERVFLSRAAGPRWDSRNMDAAYRYLNALLDRERERSALRGLQSTPEVALQLPTSMKNTPVTDFLLPARLEAYYTTLDTIRQLIDHQRQLLLPQLIERGNDRLATVRKEVFEEYLGEDGYNDYNYLLQLPGVRKEGQKTALFFDPNHQITPFLDRYDHLRQQRVQFDSSALEPFHRAETELTDLALELEELQTFRDSLQRELRELEKTYSPELVRARRNATNLGSAVEMATHLLFAFQDYEYSYRPLYVVDTTYVEKTVTTFDSITGRQLSSTSREAQLNRRDLYDNLGDKKIARWINEDQFNQLRDNPLAWDLFLGLVYQRLSAVEDAPNFSAVGVATLTTKFLGLANDVEQNLDNLRRKRALRPKEVGFRDYYPFIRSTVDLFNTVINTPVVGDSSSTLAARNPDLAVVTGISDEALSLYENIFVKNYGEAILNSMSLLKIITENGFKDPKARRKALNKVNGILRYGTFMAKMIDAESSDQVKAILRSQALPPGSSREKRESVSNFAINSYLGGSVARDNIVNAPADFGNESSFGAALSVPVGFTYSFSPSFLNKSSFSFHVPLIDLGAITAYRQNPSSGNYDIEDLPEFTWENLLSPGLFGIYNFPSSPFSLGVGGQYGPQLREIIPAGAGSGAQALKVNSWRFPMVFFNIDVPLFRLHAGPEKIISKR